MNDKTDAEFERFMAKALYGLPAEPLPSGFAAHIGHLTEPQLCSFGVPVTFTVQLVPPHLRGEGEK